jgi:hypothetical protein
MTNLCINCRRFGFCKIQLKIHDKFEKTVINTLDKHDIMMSIEYSVEDCLKYSPLAECEINEEGGEE